MEANSLGVRYRAFLGATGLAAISLFLSTSTSLADCAAAGAGVVLCTGADNDGYANTPGQPVAVTVISGATINSGGITITGPGDSTIVNSGNINGSLNGLVGGVPMSNMSLYASGNTSFVIDQNGSINQNIGVNATTGTNSLIVRLGRSVNTVAMDGMSNIVDNAGMFNSSLTLTATGGENAITNRAGAQLNTIILNGTDNIIDNAGTINQSITQIGTAGGTNHIINRPGAVISGIIDTTAGPSVDRIDNAGVINNGARLGDGNDYFVNRAGGTSGDPVTNGTIDTGAGNDYLIMADGTINGQILLGPGADIAAISGGRITSSVDAGDGNDYLLWSGGTISSGLFMGAGNDSAILSDLTSTNLTPGLPLDGGTGNDRMAWQHTQNAGGGQGMNVDTIRNWEQIALARDSHLTFQYGGDTLVLGDAGTLTGQLVIDDSTSSVIASSRDAHTVNSAVAGNPVLVSNAGTIDMTTGSPTDTNRFIVMGNYLGNNGKLALQTYLDTDSNTRSDQLVINGANGGGTASGLTLLDIINSGGPGAQTNDNGILVVDTQNGATSTADSFALSAPVAAGIYEYLLFRGGLAPNATTDSDWFLRSSVIETTPTQPPIPPDPRPVTPTVPVIPTPPPPPPPPPQPPIPPDPTPITPTVPPQPPVPTDPVPVTPTVPVAPTTPPTPITPTVPTIPPVQLPPVVPPAPPPQGPTPGEQIPIIRPEIPGYVIVPMIASQLGLAQLDTFHQRQGNQSLLDNFGEHPRVWARAFGQSFDSEWEPAIDNTTYQMSPKFDGHIWGLQLGLDVYGREHDDGSQDRAGLFYTHSQGSGDIVANALAQTQIDTGRVKIISDGLGAYWTYIDKDGWYFDAVGMANWLHGDASSYRNIGTDIDGYSLLASGEVGVPVRLDDTWTIEPQAQLIVQHVSLGNEEDPFTSIAYSGLTSVTGRLGARLEANTQFNGRPAQFFFSADIWHQFSTDSSVRFNNVDIVTETGGTSLELQAGLNAQLTDSISAFGSLSYETELDDRKFEGFGGNVGLKVKW